MVWLDVGEWVRCGGMWGVGSGDDGKMGKFNGKRDHGTSDVVDDIIGEENR